MTHLCKNKKIILTADTDEGFNRSLSVLLAAIVDSHWQVLYKSDSLGDFHLLLLGELARGPGHVRGGIIHRSGAVLEIMNQFIDESFSISYIR